MDEQSDLEVNSFLETEFFFYLIPCYYGVIALIWRYFKVMEIEPSFYARRITGEWVLKYFQGEQQRSRNSQNLTYKVLPASYVIKSKLSLYNSYLYLCMIFLSFVGTSQMFYSANHKPQSFLYLFGFMAWYMAAVVLRRECQRNMPQSIWIHRLFWILAGTFSTYKMFQDYFLPLNLIFNILFIASNLILAVYGIYRPEDSHTLQMSVSNDDIPGFIKILFQKIQLNETVRYLLKIEDQVSDGLNLDDGDITNANIDQQDLIQIGKTFKHSAETIKTEINLLNELPRRNVFVDKKIRYIRNNDKYKSCYFILTQIGNTRFEAERTLEEFRQLYSQLKEIFTPENFPKHTLPKLIETQISADSSGQNYVVGDHASKSQVIQKWLDEVFKTPIFIRVELLRFLNVGKQQGAPFITYFQNSYKMFCSKHYLVVMHNRQKKAQKLAVGTTEIKQLAGYYNKEIHQQEETESQKFVKHIKNKLEFTVTVDKESAAEVNFEFQVSCLVDKKLKLSWSLTKIQENILSLNERIEEECNCSVPFFYNMMGTKRKGYRVKLQSYRTYIEMLLRNTKHYCASLFFFIRFDPINLEVNTEGNLSFSNMQKQDQRKSRYLSEYEDRGAFIQLLRVDRTEKNSKGQDIFKFKVRRKDFSLSKTTEDVKNLRAKLAVIYKGVSFIPELEFKDCHKVEVKNKVENFLLKIENLPKIEINRQYLNFYENSLDQR